ncbi:hypothetical protein Tco_0381811 [Tanacetum coccineum]
MAETEAALLKAKPSFQNVEQLIKLLVKSLTPELSKLLSYHDFSNSLPTELKELPSKFKDITKEIKYLKKYVDKLEVELLGDLKENLTKLEKFSSTVSTASHKAGDQSVPSVGQADTYPTKGEKNIRQATITQLFKQRTKKDAEKANLKTQEIPTTTTVTSPIIPPTTLQLQSHFISKKELKKFDFVTKGGDHIHLTKEQIKEQKRIKESVKADMAKKEEVVGKEELVDLLGIKVVTEVYKAKIKKGPITLKLVPKELELDGPPSTRMDNLNKTKQILWIDSNKTLGEQDPLDKMNDLARKKRKHDDDIHDYFRSTKMFKSLVQYEDHPARTVLNEPCLGMIIFNFHQRQDFVTIEDFKDLNIEMMYTVQEIFFRLHQGPIIDDHARTFSSFLLAEVDRRNLNPLKQMRVIEQLRQ